MSMENALAGKPVGLEQKWKVLISVMFGVFMVILDSTVVNIAFPTLRREFGASLADAQWVLSIYVLALGVTTPVSGYLADRFGIKRVYVLGIGIFAFGSLLCGLSPSLGLLIVARALQGFGGGIALPLGPAQLYRAFPPKEQGTALGIFGIALVVAPALGPILGGWLVDLNIWRAIFFINVPIGILGVFLGSRFLVDYRV
jgi:EmrB/QacA subfamily drug resistance transporter